MIKKSKFVSASVVYCLAAALAITVFYESWRLILLLLVDDGGADVPALVLATAFLVGWRFDLLVTSFIMLPFTILAVIPGASISSRPGLRKIHTALLVSIVSVSFIANLADIEFFDFFNVRLNGSAMQWNDTPGIMLSMMWETYPVVLYMLLFAGFAIALYFVLKWLQRVVFNSIGRCPFWIDLAYLLLATVLFFGGARGRITDKTVMRWGVAFFSEYDFANQLALNPVYTFFYDYSYASDKKEGLKAFVDEIDQPDADQIVRRMLGIPFVEGVTTGERIHRSVHFDKPSSDPPNVILIVMESFGATKIDILDNIHGVELSPGFNRLADEGILFVNMYSEGMHTYSGVFSTLFGYPHLRTKQIMKGVRGEFHHNGLPTILRAEGYETAFYLTHDPHWDNMQGFMKSNGFKRVISSLDYDPDEYVSTWGVPDHVMFDRAFAELSEKSDSKFFATLLTASNHGPWIVPDTEFERVPAGTDNEHILNAFKYSDWALTRFVRRILEDTTFSNTLIFITSDNGAGGKRRTNPDLSQFHIPLLILDTDNRLSAGTRVETLASQIDILPTIMGLVRLDYIDYSFGHDLFDTSASIDRFAYLFEHLYIGFIEDGYYAISPQQDRGRKQLYRLTDLTTNLADSLPEILEHHTKRAESIFRAGYYNLRKPVIKSPID